MADMRVGTAPLSKACLKTWNSHAKAWLGDAGVSRGRSSELSHPMTTRRTLVVRESGNEEQGRAFD